ncbi:MULTISPECIES: hypothetical protein [unclassified Nostoc]|uniref:hypothetical protein n=1 Tax=unclassified Nostoc TaxID=2593658 RepID=UPI002601927D|nr:hypothetical protein [Nostoc sp. S13]MDF5739753.1 hypothetical protein [Nostoc sp. S13]
MFSLIPLPLVAAGIERLIKIPVTKRNCELVLSAAVGAASRREVLRIASCVSGRIE